MSDLNLMEKRQLEKLFELDSGYILHGAFSNRSFRNFVIDSTGKDVYDKAGTYAGHGDSKANRFRAFWKVEPNHVVGKLLADLLEEGRNRGILRAGDELFQACERIAWRLRQDAPVPELADVVPVDDARDFEVLVKAVSDAIERHEPGSGLDRLHTFALKYLRLVCEKHGISTDRSKPLHSLMGEYVKRLKGERLIDSGMTELILKSSISTLAAFCGVRNDHSLAHDNPILNYDESMLILGHVAGVIRFVRSIEERADQRQETAEAANRDDDPPF